MVNRNLIREFDVSEEEWNDDIGIGLMEELPPELLDDDVDISPEQIVEGKILRVDDEFVLVDVGYKSEGMISRNEWEEDEDWENRRRARGWPDRQGAGRRRRRRRRAATTIAA